MSNTIGPKQTCDGLYGALLEQSGKEAEADTKAAELAVHGVQNALCGSYLASEPLAQSIVDTPEEAP